ncbi:MAG: YbfB/YjiJ family MFS transporter [Pseudomonadota bacterium]|nr:YbfB/YjiJ family MFS transporter [Pseudomonadota bacterium]
MSTPESPRLRPLVLVALALSLGAAVSLGITRFAYGLLLPVMRDDLQWSYTLAGAMNTANALGYLLGALVTPWLMRRFGAVAVLLGGALLASVFMAASGFFTAAGPLLLQRLLAGVASAFVFVAGGLLAARLGARLPEHAGLLLGLYYGGTGWGIALSALGVPALLGAAHGVPHGWAWAWWGLALACVAATAALAWPARLLHEEERSARANAGSKPDLAPNPLPWRRMAPALAGYTLFGVGYIGYMTFVIALLREQGVGAGAITLFYALLGLAVVASARIWAGLLQRARGGGALALLNALLGVATILPALTGAWPVVLASGLLFGAVFLSVVASTTAFVRHNLPQAQWAAGISAFTILFAFGQIVGPTVVGWIADGPGGLARGLVYSAVALWLGAGLAWRQKALAYSISTSQEP